MAVKLLLNFSLIFAILGSPVFLAISFWYRRQIGKPVFVWHIPEMMIVTIVFCITALLLFTVGVVCFFSHWGYFDTNAINGGYADKFFQLGLSCVLLLSGLVMTYLGLRKMLVQMVMSDGIIINEHGVPYPNNLHSITWNQILDYYVVSDYPNAIFNFIIEEEGRFNRHAIKVPIFLKEDFQSFLEKRLYTSQTIISDDSRISSHYFSEN